MQPLAIFTRPEDDPAGIVLKHDNGQVFEDEFGTVDGRPAHVIALDETLPEGHGAEMTITWSRKRTVTHRGKLWVKERNGIALERPEFIVDDFTRPTSF